MLIHLLGGLACSGASQFKLCSNRCCFLIKAAYVGFSLGHRSPRTLALILLCSAKFDSSLWYLRLAYCSDFLCRLLRHAPLQFLMSDAVIQQAILYVNGLSSRLVLCNCPSCLLVAQGLVERSLIRKSWINPATAKGHAVKHANHSFTDDPLVYNPTPSQPNSSCLSGNVATALRFFSAAL